MIVPTLRAAVAAAAGAPIALAIGVVRPEAWWVVLVWLGLGVVLFIYLSVRSPERIRETATTFIEG